MLKRVSSFVQLNMCGAVPHGDTPLSMRGYYAPKVLLRIAWLCVPCVLRCALALLRNNRAGIVVWQIERVHYRWRSSIILQKLAPQRLSKRPLHLLHGVLTS